MPNMPIDNAQLVKRINILISERGIGKEEFYRLSGISSATFSQWNKNIYAPSKRKISNIAEVLGVSAEYLLTGEQKNSPAPSEGNGTAKQQLLDLVDHLDEDALWRLQAAINAKLQEKRRENK